VVVGVLTVSELSRVHGETAKQAILFTVRSRGEIDRSRITPIPTVADPQRPESVNNDRLPVGITQLVDK
jgi:hypothetical protein